MEEYLNGTYLVTVRVEFEDEKGKTKKRTEKILVTDAPSVKGVQDRIFKLYESEQNTWYIKNVALQNITDIVSYSDAE